MALTAPPNRIADPTCFKLDKGMFQDIKFGVRFTEHDRSNYPRNVWQLDRDILNAWGDLYSNRSTERIYYPEMFNLKEKTSAAYVSSDLEGEGWSGNIGVRLVKTKGSSNGYQILPNQPPGESLPAVPWGGFVKQQKIDKNNTFALPSVNLRFDLTKDLICQYLMGFDNGTPVDVIMMPPEVEGQVFYQEDMKSFNFIRNQLPVSRIIERIANLYLGPLDFAPTPTPISLVSFKAPDFARFPRFREAQASAQVADLEPGDALYIPTLWWHHVESTGMFNMLVNSWWPAKDTSHLASLLRCLEAMPDLAPEQCTAWKRLFKM